LVVAEVFSNNPSDDSYSIEISVNEEIQKLQAQLDQANMVIGFYGDKDVLQGGMCDRRGFDVAWYYLEKYKVVSE
jgi:hypothetical protein